MVTVVHDWAFGRAADAGPGIEAASRYAGSLAEPGRGLLLSSWSRSWQDARRTFHLPVFEGEAARGRAFEADDTGAFAEALYATVDRASAKQPVCDVVLSSGGELPASLEPGVEGSCVVNDFTFADADGVAVGREAAIDYVGAARRRDEMWLSLWARDRERPLRFFHLNWFADQGAAGAARRWPETLAFAERLFTVIDPDSVEQIFTEVLVSTGGRVPEVERSWAP